MMGFAEFFTAQNLAQALSGGAQTVSNANASTMQGLIAIDTARIFAGGIRTSEKASADFLG
jgi:hypothetical protein